MLAAEEEGEDALAVGSKKQKTFRVKQSVALMKCARAVTKMISPKNLKQILSSKIGMRLRFYHLKLQWIWANEGISRCHGGSWCINSVSIWRIKCAISPHTQPCTVIICGTKSLTEVCGTSLVSRASKVLVELRI